ncbi:Uu.00g071490.m01.CDS01 [Anthostomella pinea]|uniref:Uu.00g071490.m01.CDS01 n=1 Tax=Anthostomella pinea TaxID=933095 RepID=A0AAI8YNM9_9PEZI|nr:Uu.00g071490.m01.CDS01 [Anthostomella pinea]
MLSSSVILGLRAAQLTLAFVILGLSAYVANWYNVDTLTSPPSQVGWLLFVSLFTILSVGYLELAPRFMPRASHPYAAISLEISNALFYFAGFVALSVFISRLLFCRGSVCGAAKADIAFGAIEFLLWTGSAVLMGKDVFKGGFRRPGAQAPSKVSPMKESESAAPRYTDIPLSPYQPYLDCEAEDKTQAGWESVYLYVPKS